MTLNPAHRSKIIYLGRKFPKKKNRVAFSLIILIRVLSTVHPEIVVSQDRVDVRLHPINWHLVVMRDLSDK
ncbi:hypothetical protein H6F76_02240 [Leptolyngbya sp. FACHB-321]|nr:hypothetical protein [Leptolyngbya sp. FACHB-321]